MISIDDYDRSVRMMGTKVWLRRATEQMQDADRREIIMSFPTDRERTEAALSFVAAESIPYEGERQAPYWNMGIGNVLYLFEKSLRNGTDALDEFALYEAEKRGFYQVTGIGR